MADRPLPHVFPLGNEYRVAASLDGTEWILQRQDQRKKLLWHTICCGSITDEDPELIEMVRRTMPETPVSAVRVSLAVQRADQKRHQMQRPVPIALDNTPRE